MQHLSQTKTYFIICVFLCWGGSSFAQEQQAPPPIKCTAAEAHKYLSTLHNIHDGGGSVPEKYAEDAKRIQEKRETKEDAVRKIPELASGDHEGFLNPKVTVVAKDSYNIGLAGKAYHEDVGKTLEKVLRDFEAECPGQFYYQNKMGTDIRNFRAKQALANENANTYNGLASAATSPDEDGNLKLDYHQLKDFYEDERTSWDTVKDFAKNPAGEVTTFVYNKYKSTVQTAAHATEAAFGVGAYEGASYGERATGVALAGTEYAVSSVKVGGRITQNGHDYLASNVSAKLNSEYSSVSYGGGRQLVVHPSPNDSVTLETSSLPEDPGVQRYKEVQSDVFDVSYESKDDIVADIQNN